LKTRVTVCLAVVKKHHKCKFVPRHLSMIVDKNIIYIRKLCQKGCGLY